MSGRGGAEGGGGQAPAPDAGRGQQAAEIEDRDLRHYDGRQPDLPQETLQLFDVVLREKRCAVVGRSFFSPSLGDIGGKGFYQSLRPTQMGLSLNIDMSARAFFEPILVLDYVAKHIIKDPTRGLSDQDRIKVKRALKGVRVETHHLGHIRRYKISNITTLSTRQLMFPMDGTENQISVEQYFSQKYNVVLQYPALPAVQAGSDTKPIYLPMELCSIVEGQRFSRKLNERQVTALLKATCQRPQDRENSIMKAVGRNVLEISENPDFEIPLRSISQIKNDEKSGCFWVYAKIYSIETMSGHGYLACNMCFSKLDSNDQKFKCLKCKSDDVGGKIRLKLTLIVADDHGTTALHLCESVFLTLIGKTLEDLDEFGNLNELPVELETLIGKKAFFKVLVKDGETKSNAYSVEKVINNMDTLTKYCEYYQVTELKDNVEKENEGKGKGKVNESIAINEGLTKIANSSEKNEAV